MAGSCRCSWSATAAWCRTGLSRVQVSDAGASLATPGPRATTWAGRSGAHARAPSSIPPILGGPASSGARGGHISVGPESIPSHPATATRRRAGGECSPGGGATICHQGQRVDLGELEGGMATAGGNRRVSPRHCRAGHNPLKAETRVRIPLEPLQTLAFTRGLRYRGLMAGGTFRTRTARLGVPVRSRRIAVRAGKGDGSGGVMCQVGPSTGGPRLGGSTPSGPGAPAQWHPEGVAGPGGLSESRRARPAMTAAPLPWTPRRPAPGRAPRSGGSPRGSRRRTGRSCPSARAPWRAGP
jgi:hypothetical protein